MAITPPLLGAHASAAGGVWKALKAGKAFGANVVQFFTSNQRKWEGAVLDAAVVNLFKETRVETGLTHLMSHAGYLINLGSPNPNVLEKSRAAFRAEIERCLLLDLDYLNFHPGAALQEDRGACLERVVESLLQVAKLLEGKKLRLLFETTAGQGSTIGATFGEIAYLIKSTCGSLPVGVCMDTCHLFAAGYDIRTPEGWEATLEAFDQVVGLQYLYAFHLNDSRCSLGSRKDRHAPLGEGFIGLASFRHLVVSPVTMALPKYLETPGGPSLWEKEIALLRSFVQDP